MVHRVDAPLLEARSITKSYRRRMVLRDVTLEVRAGEAVAIVGENGVGKSTLARIAAGLLDCDRGFVRVTGRVGYSPQEPDLLDHLTADEHLVLFGQGAGFGRREALRVGRIALDRVGFPACEVGISRDLSGGTRQKLNLALALIGDPPILILDEPYQGFDRGSYLDFWEHVAGWRHEGRAVAIVTHLLAEPERVARTLELGRPRTDRVGPR
jgi:ABC-type multidrug transport system ATPase subunit